MTRHIVVEGLLLPLRIYLRPHAFRDEVAAFAPDLPEDYNVWQTRHRLRNPAFRRQLGRLLLQSGIALLWNVPLAYLTAGVLTALGFSVDWLDLTAGLILGLPIAVLVFPALGSAFGVVGSVARGLAAGTAGGAVFGAALGVALSLTGDVPLVAGLGTAWSVALSVSASAAWGAAASLVWGVAWVVAGGLVLSLAAGLATGPAAGLAGAVTSILAATHLLNLPIQIITGALSWLLVRLFPEWSPTLWRLSPPRWDEVILLPIPSLAGLLVTLYRTDPQLGRLALDEVAGHRYRGGAAHRALVRIAGEQARRVASAPALASFRKELAWLSSDVPLPEAVRDGVFGMRDVSREVASALESASATNRVRRLEAAADRVQRLRLQPSGFGSALAQWSEIIEAKLIEARRKQREEEPIPQVYVGDGRPIRPSPAGESASPFKGRQTLFQQLENALGGGEGQRSTLLLYGQRRTGKTSALLHLPERLGGSMVPAFLDLQSPTLGGAAGEVGLLSGLVEGVLQEARRHRGLRLPSVDRDNLSTDPYPAFGRWLDRVERALGRGTLLLCLDEFEVLDRGIKDGRFDTRLLSALRNIVQHHPHVAVLLSGSHRIDELHPRWASTLISTTTLPISFLEEADTRELIRKPVESFPDLYSAAAVDRIVHLTHCQPFLVQLTCALLVERMNAAGRVPPESCVAPKDADAVIAEVLERGRNYFVDLWSNQARSDVARRLLMALSQAPGDEMHRSKIRRLERDEDALREAIATLLRREIIERVDDGYRIIVPLVAEYARIQVPF